MASGNNFRLGWDILGDSLSQAWGGHLQKMREKYSTWGAKHGYWRGKKALDYTQCSIA